MTLEERLHLTGRVPQETTTVSKAYFNLTVCVIASALLSIPYSFDKTGFYFLILTYFLIMSLSHSVAIVVIVIPVIRLDKHV